MQRQTNAKQNQAIRITPKSNWRVSHVTPNDDYELNVVFNDGLSGMVKMKKMIFGTNAGVFKSLSNIELFKQVYVEMGATTWPNDLDLAPDAMYDMIKKHNVWELT